MNFEQNAETVQAEARGVCPNLVTMQATVSPVTGYGESMTGRPIVECNSAKKRGELGSRRSAVGRRRLQ